MIQGRFHGSPSSVSAIVMWEFSLALWLLSGAYWRAATRVAMATFALFASVSLSVALSGQTSCACLGRVQISPWIMFAVDCCIVLVLAYGPSGPPEHSRGTLIAQSGAVLLGLSGFALLGAIGSRESTISHALSADGPLLAPKVWATVSNVYLGHRASGDGVLAGQVTLMSDEPFTVRNVEATPPGTVIWSVRALPGNGAALHLESAGLTPGEHRVQLSISAVSEDGSVTAVPVGLFWTAAQQE